jgi:ATP-dependent RNA helicase DDX27
VQRLEALQRFRDGEFDFLLATDLASRGLDIPQVQVLSVFPDELFQTLFP